MVTRERYGATTDGVFIFIGTYRGESAERSDYDVVKGLHAAGAVGTYDAAVVTKDEDGTVHENKDEMATRHGAWGGAAVGAVLGMLFPPSVIASTAVGAAACGVGGHLWKRPVPGRCQGPRRHPGRGQAALLIVGGGTLQAAIVKAGLKAEKQVTKELDVGSKDIDSAVQEAAKQVG